MLSSHERPLLPHYFRGLINGFLHCHRGVGLVDRMEHLDWLIRFVLQKLSDIEVLSLVLKHFYTILLLPYFIFLSNRAVLKSLLEEVGDLDIGVGF